MVGNLGESLTVQSLLADRLGVEKTLTTLRPESVDLVHIHFNKSSHALVRNTMHCRTRPFDHSRRTRMRIGVSIDCAFFRALRVSKAAALRLVVLSGRKSGL